MKTCLFCENNCTYNIHEYGKNGHTAKDDMFDFFGHQIEDYLKPDDAICNFCVSIMDNVAKLKRRLLPLVFRSEPPDVDDRKPINFGKKWDVFATMNFGEEASFLPSRSPTPSNLVTCKKVVPYKPPTEVKLAELERQRSTSRLSAKSDAASEIVKAFSGRSRRKRKGHNWTHRKKSRYSSVSVDRKSVNSSYSRRSYSKSRISSPASSESTDSYENFFPPSYQTPSCTPNFNTLRYVDGCLQNKRTRAVSRQQEEEMSVYLQGGELHPCTEPDCTFICEDIDLMTTHKISRHRQLAFFLCSFCKKKYTSSEDLEIHKRVHPAGYSCIICHKEFFYDTELMEHWQVHYKNSIPCKFCGKRFFNKNVCNKHQKNVHRRNIPSRINYNNGNVQANNTKNNNFDGFAAKILLQGVDVRED